MKLADLPPKMLAEMVEALEGRYRAPIVSGPAQLATEEARHTLSFSAGQYSVVEDFRIALKNVRNKKKELPRV